jgi:membrane-associated phospholipid phosphatase
VDWGVLAYAAISSAVAIARMPSIPGLGWVLGANALVVPLVVLLNRPGLGRFGRGLAEVYPLILVIVFYGALDNLTGHGAVATHEKAVQHWEALLFGGQISRSWWQHHPSRFWSTLLHSVYASYYFIVAAGPLWFLARGEQRNLRRAVLLLSATYGLCFVSFLLYPVAGPNYEFPKPSAEFLNNPAAHLVYAMLQRGSSYGAAFPSSHVAAALVAAFATWLGARRLGLILAVPSVLLIVAVVYTQMHYAMDSLAAVVVAGAVILGFLLREKTSGGREDGKALTRTLPPSRLPDLPISTESP